MLGTPEILIVVALVVLLVAWLLVRRRPKAEGAPDGRAAKPADAADAKAPEAAAESAAAPSSASAPAAKAPPVETTEDVEPQPAPEARPDETAAAEVVAKRPPTPVGALQPTPVPPPAAATIETKTEAASSAGSASEAVTAPPPPLEPNVGAKLGIVTAPPPDLEELDAADAVSVREPKFAPPKPSPPKPPPMTRPPVPAPKPAEPKLAEPKLAEPKPTEPKPTEPKPTEPKGSEAKGSEAKGSEAAVKAAEPAKPAPKPASVPAMKAVEAPKPVEPKPSDRAVKAAEPTKAAPAATTGAAAAIAAKYLAPSNPETAELEKNDPRHAAARRLARLSVSEIKLYHEAEVTAGRAAKDLWKRLGKDIGLATQTYESRVDKEVRERFDYLYDEILRQLGEGDPDKLGPDAPKKAKAEPAPAAGFAQEAPTAVVAVEPAKMPAAIATPAPAQTPTATPAPEAQKPAAEAPKPAAAPVSETAELEKSDPKHAAARRFARVAVSEIKLYHEAEVKAGREAKDLWKRMSKEIALAISTYEQRIDKEVRERFDYLHDEIVRQLAEGDPAKLGPEAPEKAATSKAASERAVPAAKAAASERSVPAAAPAASAPSAATPAAAAAPAPPKVSERAVPAAKPAAASERNVPAAAPPAAEKPAAAPIDARAAAAAIAAKYMAPANPETAELEKSDPRHAAARRFARLSVSEIKLYHEAEVKAGRENKDLWTRLQKDIGLAIQTYESRIEKDVRDRFDYLYDEILRQLAEGDAAKLGPSAPKK